MHLKCENVFVNCASAVFHLNNATWFDILCYARYYVAEVPKYFFRVIV